MQGWTWRWQSGGGAILLGLRGTSVVQGRHVPQPWPRAEPQPSKGGATTWGPRGWCHLLQTDMRRVSGSPGGMETAEDRRTASAGYGQHPEQEQARGCAG